MIIMKVRKFHQTIKDFNSAFISVVKERTLRFLQTRHRPSTPHQDKHPTLPTVPFYSADVFFNTNEFMQNFVFAQLHCVPCLNFVMYGGKVERMRQYGMECVYTLYTVHTALHMCTCAVSVCYIGLELPIGQA